MRMTPKHIARALVDSFVTSGTVSVDDACDSALALLHQKCPGTSRRVFMKIVERELLARGAHAEGMLVVPTEHSLQAAHIEPHLSKQTGKTIHLDRKVEPELIGGAVLLVDHRRIDCSIQGALHRLLHTCLAPLD